MSTNVEIQTAQNSTQTLMSRGDSYQKGPHSYVPKIISGKYFDKACMILAEVLGTASLMFFGCMANVPISGAVFAMAPPITFGLTVMMIIQMFGHISFALLNPAVAITAVVYDLISIKVNLKCPSIKSSIHVIIIFIRWLSCLSLHKLLAQS